MGQDHAADGQEVAEVGRVDRIVAAARRAGHLRGGGDLCLRTGQAREHRDVLDGVRGAAERALDVHVAVLLGSLRCCAGKPAGAQQPIGPADEIALVDQRVDEVVGRAELQAGGRGQLLDPDGLGRRVHVLQDPQSA
jgi:hypothetical protein